MNLFKLAFFIFIFYLGYKLVFEFIIPVYKATKQMKNKMADMHQRMQQEQQAQQVRQDQPQPRPKKDFSKDYIEYEDIK